MTNFLTNQDSFQYPAYLKIILGRLDEQNAELDDKDIRYVVRLSGKIFFDSGTDLGSFDSTTHHSGHGLTTYDISNTKIVEYVAYFYHKNDKNSLLNFLELCLPTQGRFRNENNNGTASYTIRHNINKNY